MELSGFRCPKLLELVNRSENTARLVRFRCFDSDFYFETNALMLWWGSRRNSVLLLLSLPPSVRQTSCGGKIGPTGGLQSGLWETPERRLDWHVWRACSRSQSCEWRG
eukprot:822299-Prorocentrum_minimum.AAC.3